MTQRKRRETKKFRQDFIQKTHILNCQVQLKEKKLFCCVCEKQWEMHWTRVQHQALLAKKEKNQTIIKPNSTKFMLKILSCGYLPKTFF